MTRLNIARITLALFFISHVLHHADATLDAYYDEPDSETEARSFNKSVSQLEAAYCGIGLFDIAEDLELLQSQIRQYQTFKKMQQNAEPILIIEKAFWRYNNRLNVEVCLNKSGRIQILEARKKTSLAYFQKNSPEALRPGYYEAELLFDTITFRKTSHFYFPDSEVGSAYYVIAQIADSVFNSSWTEYATLTFSKLINHLKIFYTHWTGHVLGPSPKPTVESNVYTAAASEYVLDPLLDSRSSLCKLGHMVNGRKIVAEWALKDAINGLFTLFFSDPQRPKEEVNKSFYFSIDNQTIGLYAFPIFEKRPFCLSFFTSSPPILQNWFECLPSEIIAAEDKDLDATSNVKDEVNIKDDSYLEKKQH